MTIYINREKYNLKINGVTYLLKIGNSQVTQNIQLISSDNYNLKDINGVYLTVKEIGDII